jgi:hypothetical protein
MPGRDELAMVIPPDDRALLSEPALNGESELLEDFFRDEV